MFTEKFFEGPGASSLTTYVGELALILIGAFILRLMLNTKYKSQIEDLEHELSMLNAKSSQESFDVSDLENEWKARVDEQKKKVDELNAKLSDTYATKAGLEVEITKLKSLLEEKSKDVEVQPVAQTSVPSEESIPEIRISTGVSEVSSTSDDLKKIEGIGPKIAQMLADHGIVNFSDLSNASLDRIRTILETGGPNYAVHDPTTWPEQAKLANEGRWTESSCRRRCWPRLSEGSLYTATKSI